jgi:hypothetical protein
MHGPRNKIEVFTLSTYNKLELNPGLRGDRPATWHLSNDTVFERLRLMTRFWSIALDSFGSACDLTLKTVIKSNLPKKLGNFVNIISYLQLVEKQTLSS